MPKTALILLLLLLSCSISTAQDTTDADSAMDVDTTENTDTSSFRTHSPRKATIMSAVLPGLGQAYNKKYWKIPIVYAGLGGSVYFVIRNHNFYTAFKEAYTARVDDDPNTVDNRFQPQYSNNQVQQFMNTYRRWRDLSVIAGAAFYVLNILDASVDAYLYDFDVSDDLSFRINPATLTPQRGTTAFGVKVSLNVR